VELVQYSSFAGSIKTKHHNLNQENVQEKAKQETHPKIKNE